MVDQAWSRERSRYNAEEISRKLLQFKPSHLDNEDNQRCWVEFAKQFSQTQLQLSDVKSMNYETFTALQQIMSKALAKLSLECKSKREQIEVLEAEEQKLQLDLKQLNKIEEKNKRCQKNIQQELQRLSEDMRNDQ